jgi:hypothetical protein
MSFFFVAKHLFWKKVIFANFAAIYQVLRWLIAARDARFPRGGR